MNTRKVPAPATPRSRIAHPDPEVVAQAKRRSFTAEYKQRVLSEADRATGSGGVGALHRARQAVGPVPQIIPAYQFE